MNFKKTLGAIFLCIVIELVDCQSYSYSLPSGYVSVIRPATKIPIQIPYQVGYSPHWNYNRYQPRTFIVNPHYQRGYYKHITHPQFSIASSKPEPVNNLEKSTTVSEKLVVLKKQDPRNTISTGSAATKLQQQAKKGFKLLDDLLETALHRSATAKDSDITEVDAMKTIFSDVIDEIIRQVEKNFNENNLDRRISDAFVWGSKATKKFLAEASNLRAITVIMKPYLTYVKEFTARGFESVT